MRITPMALDAAKGMFADGLPSFVILWVLFNVIIVEIYRIR